MDLGPTIETLGMKLECTLEGSSIHTIYMEDHSLSAFISSGSEKITRESAKENMKQHTGSKLSTSRQLPIKYHPATPPPLHFSIYDMQMQKCLDIELNKDEYTKKL